MQNNFETSLVAVLQHEGGYVNDPQDAGGATNKGITQEVYDAWREVEKVPKQTVRLIHPWEISEIYKNQYWNKLNANRLSSGIDYCLFDFAVNSGVNRAARYLQRVIGAEEDGQIGSATLARIPSNDENEIIDKICDLRQEFLERQLGFPHFGTGWTERVKEVRAKAKEMVEQ